MKDLIERPSYIEQLKQFQDKDLIKVITGIRRSGKSTLCELFIKDLKQSGVKPSQIIHMKLTEAEYAELSGPKELYDRIMKLVKDSQKTYVFLDEVQEAPDFEKLCDYLYENPQIDLYITGSNAHLLSSELATLLSGRYVEIKVQPLSFREYCSARPEKSPLENYLSYTTDGAFPYLLSLETPAEVRAYLEGLYNTIVIKDVAKRNNFSDLASLNDVARFIFDNIGNPTSSNNISNTLKSAKRPVSVPTVENYLKAFADAFIIYRVERYDIKGKKHLSGGYKYYVADTGLRYYLLGGKPADLGHILENVVYLELKRRGNEVYVGKMKGAEVDFIAVDQNRDLTYYQVAYTTSTPEVLERELSPLREIPDHNPKYLLTLDQVPYASYDGIKQINALKWLLGEE